MQLENTNDSWTEVIIPKRKWLDFRFQELWRYRDLVALFVRRDFIAQYKQTVLGPLWHLLQPLITAFIFYVIFGRVAQLPSDGIPPFLFYLSGITIWNYFSGSLTTVAETFIKNANIFGKVYFPRLTVPVSTVISRLISFVIQFGLLVLVYILYSINGYELGLNKAILLLPLILLIMAALALGMGIIIASLTIRYRDLHYLLTFGIQLGMYLTPVLYPVSFLSERYQNILFLNPLTPVLEAFRYAFLGKGVFSYTLLAYSILVTFLIFLGGVLIFNRVEKNFMDSI